eukprot:COSAG02_NODE_48914_length_330_cov_1.238095_1_plen_53_part_10
MITACLHAILDHGVDVSDQISDVAAISPENLHFAVRVLAYSARTISPPTVRLP